MKHRVSISHDQAIVAELRRDARFAAEYLRAAIEDTDQPKVLLVAPRQTPEARGGVAKVATAASAQRESLCRALSPRGKPAPLDASGGHPCHRITPHGGSRVVWLKPPSRFRF